MTIIGDITNDCVTRVNSVSPVTREMREVKDKWGNMRAVSLSKRDAIKQSRIKTGTYFITAISKTFVYSITTYFLQNIVQIKKIYNAYDGARTWVLVLD